MREQSFSMTRFLRVYFSAFFTNLVTGHSAKSFSMTRLLRVYFSTFFTNLVTLHAGVNADQQCWFRLNTYGDPDSEGTGEI